MAGTHPVLILPWRVSQRAHSVMSIPDNVPRFREQRSCHGLAALP
jgi:hypothetical protein